MVGFNINNVNIHLQTYFKLCQQFRIIIAFGILLAQAIVVIVIFNLLPLG